MAAKTVVVLGGGIGGLVAANLLRKRLGKEHRVVMIDKHGKHLFAPSYLWVLTGQRHPSQVTRDLAKLQKKGIEVVSAEVSNIDPERSIIRADSQEFPYDYSIVALGAELAPETIPGFSQVAHNLYDLEGLVRLRTALLTFAGGRVVILIPSLPFKCPAAPYEAALLLDSILRKKGLRGRFEIDIFTPETLPMPVAGPVLGNAVKTMVERQGIRFHPNSKLLSIRADEKRLTFEGGKEAAFDLLVAVPPHRSPEVVRRSALASETGWIQVDSGTLRTKYDNVFAIGDVTAIKLPTGMMLPKAGVFAHYQAEVVAHNIAWTIKGEKPGAAFDGRGSCFVEMGGGKAAYATGIFYSNPPAIKLHRPGRTWHWRKILFEKYWMWRWF